MEQVGRFGGRASEKAGTRDMPLAMDDWSPEAREAAAKARKGGKHPGLSLSTQRELTKDAQGFSELENEYNEGMDTEVGNYDDPKNARNWGMHAAKSGKPRSSNPYNRTTEEHLHVAWNTGYDMTAKDEYRDEAAEENAERRGYREDKEQVATGPTRPERLEFREPVGIVDSGTGRFGGRGSDKAGGRDLAMDPLTSKGEEIKSAMEKQYGPKKGEQVFYASANKGTIKGVHE